MALRFTRAQLLAALALLLLLWLAAGYRLASTSL
jgi:hypothetical protein